MDDANARDWRQLKKTRRLAGVKGHLHAAKRILDAEREQRHPDRKLAKRKQVRCNAPWARQFVPGAVESGVELPEGVQQSSFTCPPDVKAWVARYRHPTLQNAGKRPTRSNPSKMEQRQNTWHSKWHYLGFGVVMKQPRAQQGLHG